MSVYPPDLGPRRTPGISQEEIAAIRKTLLAKRVMIFLACVVVAALLVVSTIGIVLIRSTQTGTHSTVISGAKAAKAASRGTKRIIGCTTPGRPCFDQGVRRQGRAIAALTLGNQKAAAAAASCAAQMPHPTFRNVYQCMVTTLTAPKH